MARKKLLSTRFSGLALIIVVAAGAAAQVPVRPPLTGTGPARNQKQEPCWQIAGVSPGAIQERRSIQRQAQSEVEAVCANSSLTAQQKSQEIRQIREREHQQIDAIITPAQMEEMRACQESRGHGGHAGVGHGHGGGPCGEFSEPHPHPVPGQQPEAPPQKDTEPN